MLLHSLELQPYKHTICREPRGVSEIPKETFEQVF